MADAPAVDSPVMAQRAAAEPARVRPTAIARPRRSLVRPLLFAALPIAIVVGGYFYVTGGQVMSTENAYVQADMVGVSTDVAGIVREVAVRDNQRVALGDILYRLDDQPFVLALRRAEAQIGNVRNDLNGLKSNYRDMQTQIAQAKVDIDYYNREFGRQQDLASHQAASLVTLDLSRHNYQTAQQKLASLNQQLQGLAAALSGNPDIAIDDHPRMQDAIAQRDEAARQLAHTVVRAPMPGIVTNVPSVQPGQYLAVSTTAFSVVATDHVWVQASPKETELTHVVSGQKVTVTVDTYPDQSWEGTVESISPASGSSFSLLPAQNTTGNWVKVVQRIPMRIRIDTPAGKPPLRVGMSVVVDVDTGHARGLPGFMANWFGAKSEPTQVGAAPASEPKKVAQAPAGNG
jgi:membrane fusion protein (multidrug efflux system)